MATSAVLSQIKTLQAALSVFSLLDFNSQFFPPDTTPQNGSSYDYVVVGGGNAGSVVSARLVEAGFSVLVIEAGGLYNLESHYPGLATYVKNTRVYWNSSAEPGSCTGDCHTSGGLSVPKVLGGRGAVDFMIYARGNPSDYHNWSDITNDESWEWENMMKYFKKSEALKDPAILNTPFRQFHGIDGKVNITRDTNDVCDEYIEGFERAGEPTPLDNIGNGSLGYSRSLFYIVNGIRNDAAYAYLMPIKDNPKIHVSLHSLATKIIFDKDKKAVGVEFIKNGTKITVKATKEVIVSAGPIKSPQLLMLSGIGCKKELQKWELPCISNLPVGQNLQNLIGVFLAFKTNTTADPEPFKAHKFLSPLVMGYGAVNKSSIYPDYETLNFIIDDYYFFLTFCGFTLAFDNEICDRLNFRANNTQLLTTILFNLKVKSRGEILLRSTDPEDSPKVITNYYSNDKDLDSVIKQIQQYMKIVSTPYFKAMGLEFMDATNKCNHLKKGSKKYWRCYALCMTAGTGRYVGANSMGSVVDTELCVYGVQKLRVVDASIIPCTLGGPTFAPIVAVAEKAAEMIISAAKMA